MNDRSDEPGAPIYADYIADSLREQEANKATIETRALSVIASSATLATLLFGLVAFVPKPAEFQLSVPSASFLAASLAAFAAAAFAALIANAPLSYRGPRVAGLRSLIDEHWQDSAAVARKLVAVNRLARLRVARELNRLKAWALVMALAFEALAVVLLALAVTSAVFSTGTR